MKIMSFIVAGLVATSGVAYAAQNDPSSLQGSAEQGKTRAEVKAETLRALAGGEVPFGDRAYPQQPVVETHATRAQVKGELLRAIAARELHFSDTAYPDDGILTTPRAKVRAPAGRQAATTTGAPAS